MTHSSYSPKLVFEDFDYHPPKRRPFFTKRTSLYLVITAVTLGLSAPFAPGFLTALLAGIFAVGFAILKIIPKLILPSTSRFVLKMIRPLHKSIYHTNTTLRLSDRTLLRGVFLKPAKATTGNKLVIHLHGNAALATKEDQAILNNSLHGAFQEHYILDMNYRGTGNSEGGSPGHAQLIEDSTDLVRAAQNAGYHDITLFGHSFGGSIAPSVAKTINKSSGVKVKLIAHHTFYTLDYYLSSQMPLPLKWISKKVTTLGLSMIGFRYNLSLDDWNSIEGEDHIAIGGDDHDDVIRPPISLATKLLADITSEKKVKGKITVRKKEHNIIHLHI
jgi:alpha/beta superfamily hydrolase